MRRSAPAFRQRYPTNAIKCNGRLARRCVRFHQDAEAVVGSLLKALADRDAEAFTGLARALDALGRGEEARTAIERLRQFDAAGAERLERELKEK